MTFKLNHRLLICAATVFTGLFLCTPVHSDDIANHPEAVRPAVSTNVQNWLDTSPEPQFNDTSLRHFRRPMLTTGVSLIGTGVSITAIGMPFVILDGKCSTTKVGENGNCVSIHNTIGTGIALLATGITFTAVGIVLLVVRAVKQNRYKLKMLREDR